MGRPAQVVILRHAEKPVTSDDPHLSPRGRQRASALAVGVPARFHTPHAIFATAPSRDSVRPIETVTPLSEALAVPIHERWKDAEYATLATDVLQSGKYDDKRVVICWHHEKIPQLARALGANSPSTWDDSVFDRYWVLNFGNAAAVTFEDVPQRLLPGDSST